MTQDKVSTNPKGMDHADPVVEPHERTVDLIVLGPPVPKARPRVVRKPQGVMTYTPGGTRQQMQAIRHAYVERYDGMVFGKHEPLVLNVLPVMERPASVPKSREWPVVAPDLVNIVQLVQDALEGFAYPKDAAIVGFGEAFKLYGYPPRTQIRVRLATEEELRQVRRVTARAMLLSRARNEGGA